MSHLIIHLLPTISHVFPTYFFHISFSIQAIKDSDVYDQCDGDSASDVGLLESAYDNLIDEVYSRTEDALRRDIGQGIGTGIRIS